MKGADVGQVSLWRTTMAMPALADKLDTAG